MSGQSFFVGIPFADRGFISHEWDHDRKEWVMQVKADDEKGGSETSELKPESR